MGIRGMRMATRKRTGGSSRRLFRDPSGQSDLFEKSLKEELEEREATTVECLGLTFESEDSRRTYFLDQLQKKLDDPKFRKTPGFPKGTDEDILRLSDPPYYTACPNPFLEAFVSHYGKPYDLADDYHCEPFAADVSEGKTDPVYNGHSYHTKVPHKAIMRYILHYTKPGDIVFDGFCGTGMTAVAAHACAAPDSRFKNSVEAEMPNVQWGARRCILADLSPAATFISRGYNILPPIFEFRKTLSRELARLEKECAWLYSPSLQDHNKFHYAVWTDVFSCPNCGHEFSFWDVAIDFDGWTVRSELACPQCDAKHKKSQLKRVIETYYDDDLDAPHMRGKYVLSTLNQTIEGTRTFVEPSKQDKGLVDSLEGKKMPYWHPAELMLFREGQWGQMWRSGYHSGVTHVHHFFTKRNLWALAAFWDRISKLPIGVRHAAQYVFTGTLQIASRMSRFRFDSRRKGATAGGIMNGVLFIPSLSKEGHVPDLLKRRLDSVLRQYKKQSGWNADKNNIAISTASCSQTGCPDSSVDYIFVDPPFGSNIMYSELSFLWESWLRLFTNQDEEAIVSSYDHKELESYHGAILAGFKECCRILKPGRWVTVEFHNSQNRVWNTIQEAIQQAGLVVADVRTLDKRQGSFKQVTTVAAVKQDLVISAYKPSSELQQKFNLEAGTNEGAWSFVRAHLKHLPVFVGVDGAAEVVGERLRHLLFDRMVAFHVQRGVSVPIAAGDFHVGLAQRFPARDNMYFLPEQLAEYDRRRTTVSTLQQLTLVVSDEATAIQWIRQQLHDKPQTFQQLQPQLMRQLKTWAQHELTVELSEILEENFLCYSDDEPVPSQIHSYLSTNFKDLRNRNKQDPVLKERAKSRWYVPDPRKQADLEKLRERTLLREFDEYRTSKQRKLKQFRTEALRAGFKTAYNSREYQTIVAVAGKIPDAVLQEDEKLLMYYDVASMRLGED